jgi:hypothetical protein
MIQLGVRSPAPSVAEQGDQSWTISQDFFYMINFYWLTPLLLLIQLPNVIPK